MVRRYQYDGRVDAITQPQVVPSFGWFRELAVPVVLKLAMTTAVMASTGATAPVAAPILKPSDLTQQVTVTYPHRVQYQRMTVPVFVPQPPLPLPETWCQVTMYYTHRVQYKAVQAPPPYFGAGYGDNSAHNFVNDVGVSYPYDFQYKSHVEPVFVPAPPTPSLVGEWFQQLSVPVLRHYRQQPDSSVSVLFVPLPSEGWYQPQSQPTYRLYRQQPDSSVVVRGAFTPSMGWFQQWLPPTLRLYRQQPNSTTFIVGVFPPRYGWFRELSQPTYRPYRQYPAALTYQRPPDVVVVPAFGWYRQWEWIIRRIPLVYPDAVVWEPFTSGTAVAGALGQPEIGGSRDIGTAGVPSVGGGPLDGLNIR